MRLYLSKSFDAGNIDDIKKEFNALSKKEFNSVDDIESWLLLRGELLAALSEEKAKRYISMTCNTLDQNIQKKYNYFISEIEPVYKKLDFELRKKYIKNKLDNDRYFVLNRSIQTSVDIFRDENIPLEVDDETLKTEYQKIISEETVEYMGEEKTLTQMSPLLLKQDRSLRQEVWEMISRRRLEDGKKLDEILNKMILLREKMAKNAGFQNFRDYMFRVYCRFDYSPDDCMNFHNAIEEVVVPFSRELDRDRMKQMGLESLRPWDTAVDPKGRQPLKPFDKCDELINGCLTIFNRIDKRLGFEFKKLIDNNLLDLDNRKGKAPGGYLYPLEESRVPFIFMNAVGVQDNVETLLHESGHAFHHFAAGIEELYDYRQYGMEIAEVASMSMELIGMGNLDVFYKNKDDVKRARREQLEGIIKVLTWIASVDAFQHWLYLTPRHTTDERREHWLDLRNRFGGLIDYTGYEDAVSLSWQAQNHIYTVPFYYIEYGIAQLGALQVYRNYVNDPKRALTLYLEGLSLGGSQPLPKLFEALGIEFDFSLKIIKELIDFLSTELRKISHCTSMM